MNRISYYTSFTMTMEVVGGCSSSLSDTPKGTPILAATRMSKLSYLVSPSNSHRLRVIMKDKENFLRDPVFFFVALAFADHAFRGISSLDQFWAVRPPHDRTQFEFQWNVAVMETPVFRSTDKNGALGIESPAWITTQMYRDLNNLTRLAGYEKGTITVHTLRRGFGNRVERECVPIGLDLFEKFADLLMLAHVTSTELSQVLGHTSGKMYEQSYQSRISSIDGQALFLREAPNVRPIEYLRSAARHKNTDLPRKMPAQVAADFEDSQEMKALRSKLAELTPTELDERKKIIEMQLRLRKQALREYQDQWLQDEYVRQVSTASVDCKKRNSAETEVDNLRPFFPERVRVADMIGTLMPFLHQRRKSALEGLIAICNPADQRIWYRPDEIPIEGRCPVLHCGIDIST